MMKGMRETRYALLTAFAIVLGLTGCDNLTRTPAPTTPTTKTYVYAVDTTSGNVFQIDPSTNAVASTALVTIGQNSSAEIRFGGGKAFVAVGNDTKNKPGVYYFEPSISSPAATMLGTTGLSAQYLCVKDGTTAYMSVADYSNPVNNGVYSFNPSSPTSGYTAVAVSSSYYPQDIVIGADGYLYVSNYAGCWDYAKPDSVLKIDTSSKSVVATFPLTSSDPIGLLPGTYNGSSGVFVAESGAYTTSQIDGVIDFIPIGLADGSAATKVISIPASRLAAFNDSTLVVTGGYPSHTNIVALNGASATAHEAYYSTDKTFGSSDVDVYNGYAYIAGGFGSNSVYKVTSDGAVSVLAVGSSTDSITNVGIGTTEE
jgi:hypothetical protein